MGAAPCPAGPGSAEPRQSRERAELTTATPQPASLLPRPHFCAHPTLPAAYPPRRLGGTQVEKGECQPLKMGPPPPPPTDSEGSEHFNKGNLSLGTPWVSPGPPARAATSHCRAQGHMIQSSPLGTPTEPVGQGGGGQRVGVRECVGCRVPALGTSRALGALRLRTVSSHSRALGPSQLWTRPPRAGQPWTPAPSSAPRRLQGRRSLAEDTGLLSDRAGFGHLPGTPWYHSRSLTTQRGCSQGSRAEESSERWVV